MEQPAARAAAHEEAASTALVGQADRLPNPELSSLRDGQQAGTRTTTVQINQPIELGGKRRARVAAAQGAAALAHGDWLAKRQDIRADVIAAYHDVLVAGHRLALAQALTDLARRTVGVAGKRVAAGKISPIDETRARLAAVDAASALNEATAVPALAKTTLGALIGRPPNPLQRCWPGPAHRPPSGARGQLAARQAQADVERAARVPDVTLSVGTQKDDQMGRRQAVVGLSVPLPLFNRNEDALRAALRRTDAASDELAAAQAGTAAALTAARTRYETAGNEVLLLRRDVVPAALALVFALWLRGLPLSISAAVGFIALSGVAVLNGLVMRSLREQGRAGQVAGRADDGARRLTRFPADGAGDEHGRRGAAAAGDGRHRRHPVVDGADLADPAGFVHMGPWPRSV